MKQVFNWRQLKAMLPYFLLAVAVIIAWEVIEELHVFVQFLKRVWVILIPFLYGFLLAYVLNIPCAAIQKLLGRCGSPALVKRKKLLAITTVYLLLVLVVFVALSLVIPSVYGSVVTFFANFHTYYRDARELVDAFNELDIIGISINLDEVAARIRSAGFQRLSGSFVAISGISSGIFKVFLVFISSFYILVEKEKFKAFLCRLLGALTAPRVYKVALLYARKINGNFKRYIYTQTLDGCIIGTLATLELALLGSPFALTLGIMLGVANYIPYFGSIIGTSVTVVIVAFTQGLSTAAITALILLVTQQVDGNIIQPRLLGGSFSLSPLLVIISITVGGACAGVLGMVAAVPIIAVCKDILDDILLWLEEKKSQA